MSRGKQRPDNHDVCKPCWELHYCPYGDLVELFPIPHGDLSRFKPQTKEQKEEKARYSPTGLRKHYAELVREMRASKMKTPEDIFFWAELLSANDPVAHEQVAEFEGMDIGCRVFGHCCPVFMKRSYATETRERRRWGRYIPRDVMFKVARRDDYRCQLCRKNVDERDMHFDHIIPVSKGGRTSVTNIRLLCGDCNRRKSDGLAELLADELIEPSSPTMAPDPERSTSPLKRKRRGVRRERR